jgi:hypothetical protein
VKALLDNIMVVAKLNRKGFERLGVEIVEFRVLERHPTMNMMSRPPTRA